jgi:PAS domain S-box-containing protein
MKDMDKDKGQLIGELEQLRQRIAELEVSEAESKKIEEALKQSELRYKELAESITDVFFAMDNKLRYTYWNRASEELTGISAKDALRKRFHDIFPDDEASRRAENAYRKALTTRKPQHFVNNFPIGDRDYVFDISAYPTAHGICVYVKDVTERTKLEEALKESEIWYRHIFDNAPFGIGFSSIEGKVINLNKAMETITGYSAEEISKVNLADTYVNKADREVLLEELRQHGGVVDYPVQLRRKDGTPYNALLSVRLTTIGDREFVQTICHDVTERKRAEEELRRSEQRFRTFFEDAPVYCYMVSPESKILDINKVALKTLGYTKEEIIGKPLIATVYAPGSRPKARRLFTKWKETGKLENEELNIITKEGAERTVLLSAHAVRDAGGKLLYSISMQRDITERKRAEEALRESEERYRFLVELSPEAIFVASEGKHVFANSAGLKLLGASSPDQIIGKPVIDVIHPDYREIVAQRMRKAMETGMAVPSLEEKFLRLDGTEIDVEVRGSPLIYQGKPAMQVVVRDVSERKQVEESLRLSERNFRDSIENSPLGIRIVSEDGKSLYANQALLDIYGYSSVKELEAVPGKHRYTPESYAEHRKRVKKRKLGEHVLPNYEISIVRKDGQVRYLAVSRGEVLWDGEKQFQVVYQDITERKRAEEALRQREEHFRALIENSSDVVTIIDSLGVVQYQSPNYKTVWGREPNGEIGRDLFKDVHPDDLALVGERFNYLLTNPDSSIHIEVRARHENGSWRTIDVVGRNLLDHPAVRGIVVNFRDITERRRAEKALRDSETHYRLLAENVRDVIWATDMDFRFTYVSPSVKYLGGRTAEEVMSLSIGQLLTPSSQELAMKVFAEELVMANATPQDPTRSRTLEVEILRRDGSALWAELKMNFMRDAAGRPVGVLGVMRDISERKKAEEERIEFEQKAQLASHLASVGELSAGIAHEINNPLTGVIGYAELLMQEDVPEHIKNDLEIIRDGAKRVASIVKGLLTFARQSKPERTVVDINQVIEVCLRLRAYELETSNIKVVTNLAPDLPLTIADPGQLQQVFLNLLINAEMEVKLAHGKGKLIIKAEQVDNNIRISFKDDGPGIAKENLEKIFDPFFTTREIGKGTGLGLSICHGIVTEHGGRIWAESKLGKGATFIVELPIVTEEKPPRRTKVARKLERATKGKILVVDDEPVVRRLLSQILTAEGHEVEATDDGKDALNRIKGNRYSLILLDMKLPGMSGSELYERIKEISESLAQRVVFITGDVMGADTEAFLARTEVPYIHKPFDVKQLKAEIGRLLAIPRPKGTAKSQISNKKPKVKS